MKKWKPARAWRGKDFSHLRPDEDWRLTLHEIIFEADTRPGKIFDVLLIIFILLSIFVPILDSVAVFHQKYSRLFDLLEWIFTILFTFEYFLRLICVKKPLNYAKSFYGLIDLISILPAYLGLIFGALPSLIFVRVLRVLRIFRVFKLGKYVRQAQLIGKALKESFPKITVFLTAVGTLLVIVASLMHLIEGPENGFSSIPESLYWAVVTLTTVGYGDISPATPVGKSLAMLLMLTGYGVIAVPTGIITVDIVKEGSKSISTQVCPNCSKEGHDENAVFCKYCGTKLNER